MNNTINKEYFDNNHVMLDIETLSTKDNAVVTQIAMVRFCPFTGEAFESINRHISIQSCLDLGLVIDENTLKFWLSQSKEAQNMAIKFGEDADEIYSVMASIDQFLELIEDVRIWGKGPGFDLSKLGSIYQLSKMEKPWKFYNERCVRTMIADVDSARELIFNGVKHCAHDDCIHQINQVKEALNVKYK